MNKELEHKIDLVCEAIDKVFADNAQERMNQILEFASVVSQAPNDRFLEKAVDIIIFSLDDVFETVKGKLN